MINAIFKTPPGHDEILTRWQMEPGFTLTEIDYSRPHRLPKDRLALFDDVEAFDPEGGPMYIRETMRILDSDDFTDAERQKVYHDNIANLLGLSL